MDVWWTISGLLRRLARSCDGVRGFLVRKRSAGHAADETLHWLWKRRPTSGACSVVPASPATTGVTYRSSVSTLWGL